MQNSTLTPLADDYAAAIADTDSLLKACAEEIVKAKKARRNILLSRLRAKQAILYSQRRELAEIEYTLRNYYKFSGGAV